MRRTLVTLCIGLVSLCWTQSEIETYLNEAISLLEINAENRELVDWVKLREEVFEQARDLSTTVETHPLIRTILKDYLHDRAGYFHSTAATEGAIGPLDASTGFRILLPDWVVVYVWPGSPAAVAGMQVGDQLVSVNGITVVGVDTSYAPEVPGGSGGKYSECKVGFAEYCRLLMQIYTPESNLEISRLGEAETSNYSLKEEDYERQLQPIGLTFGDIGYIEIPPGGNEQTNQETRAFIEEQRERCGWIVDIRRHAGGAYLSINTIRPLWDAENKAALPMSQPPIAYLLSPLTHSGGEGVAFSLDRFSHAWSFGEQTGGNHPGMGTFTLSDGAILAVTRGSGGHAPDAAVKIDWTRFQTKDDPVIQAAMSWLKEQPSCQTE